MGKLEIVVLLCLTMLFMTAISAIDIGATMYNLGLRGENLFFVNVEPRIIYHAGLLISTLCFLILALMYVLQVKELKW